MPALALAMIVIGGNISLASLHRGAWTPLSGCSTDKINSFTYDNFISISILKLNPLISIVAIIQACMPTSITLSIIGRNYETKNQDLLIRVFLLRIFYVY